jgi:hypothetical protein
MSKKIQTIKEFFDNYFKNYDETKVIDDEFNAAIKNNTKIILQGIKNAIGDHEYKNIEPSWILIPRHWFDWISHYWNGNGVCFNPNAKTLTLFGIKTYVVDDDGPVPMVLSKFGKYEEILL